MFTLNYINEHVYTIYMPQNVPFIGYLQMDIVYLNDAPAARACARRTSGTAGP